MSIYRRVALFAVCLFLIPAGLFAQAGDICSKLPVVDDLRQLGQNNTNSEVVVQQMRDRSEMLARQEMQRFNWVVQMVPVKYLDSASSLKAICIFPAEIVLQSAQHLVSVRAPAENMTAITDAIKRLDVPQMGPKSVEWTTYVLVASDQTETLRSAPATVSAVVEQLKGMLAYKQFYLLETMFGTIADGKALNLNGGVRGLASASGQGGSRDSNYSFSAIFNVGNGEPASASVRVSQLNFQLTGENTSVRLFTDVDIPAGKQVVVGKSTSGDRAYILVVSAKILN